MVQIARRNAVRMSAAAAAMAAVGSSRAFVSAADTITAGTKEEAGISRTKITRASPGIPVISYVVTHNKIAYVSGVTADPGDSGDIKAQTRKVLGRIDALLASVGSSKSRLLTSQVWLTDMAMFDDHNDAWNDWVDVNNPPVRACLLSPRLWRPGLLVEILVTAAI